MVNLDLIEVNFTGPVYTGTLESASSANNILTPHPGDSNNLSLPPFPPYTQTHPHKPNHNGRTQEKDRS